jgi:SAM-dependent methyltransferase
MATDPSGKYFVETSEIQAKIWKQNFEFFGAKNVSIKKLDGPSKLFYIDIDPRQKENKAAIFKTANVFWDVYSKKNKVFSNEFIAMAKERNEFLFASGVTGEGLARNAIDPSTPMNPLPLTVNERKQIEKYRGQYQASPPPLILDLAGEGRYRDAFNVNIQPWNSTTVSADRTGNIPYFIYGNLKEALPFESESAVRIYLENVQVFDKAVSEIVRIIKPGGAIFLETTGNAADPIIKAVSKKYHGIIHGSVPIFTNLKAATWIEIGQVTHIYLPTLPAKN